jgi:hypothetical protein
MNDPKYQLSYNGPLAPAVREEILTYRRAGRSWAEIGAAIGYSHSHARALVEMGANIKTSRVEGVVRGLQAMAAARGTSPASTSPASTSPASTSSASRTPSETAQQLAHHLAQLITIILDELRRGPHGSEALTG